MEKQPSEKKQPSIWVKSHFQAFGDIVYPVMYGGIKPGQDKLDKLKEVLGWMNDFVVDGKFAAGTSHMTLADISLLVTYSFIKVFPWKLKQYICQSDPSSAQNHFQLA